MKLRIFLGLTIFLLPALSWAQVGASPSVVPAEGGVSRREGFLLLWEGIRRPAEETREEPFFDVPESAPGSLEITYAKSRGILDDAELFRPDNPLERDDALLWLLRTRNVAELTDMEAVDLPLLLERYPIARQDSGAFVASREELLELARSLDTLLVHEVHEVSLYGEEFHGDGTAFGETFDMHALTAAHRTFPWNTLVEVTNVDNDAKVTVRINDRGPYVEGRDMDLSLAAFTAIAPRSQGVLHATFRRLGDASLVDRCGEEPLRFQKRITRDVRFDRGVPHGWEAKEELVLTANRAFVVKAVAYPDGTAVRVQDFVHPGERFRFSPAIVGRYTFTIGNGLGRVRDFTMDVREC